MRITCCVAVGSYCKHGEVPSRSTPSKYLYFINLLLNTNKYDFIMDVVSQLYYNQIKLFVKLTVRKWNCWNPC